MKINYKKFIALSFLVLAGLATFAQKHRPVEVKVDFGEEVRGFDLSDVKVEGGIINGDFENRGNGKYAFYVDVPPIEGSIDITVVKAAAADQAGNKSVGNQYTKKYDRLLPVPLIKSDKEKFSAKDGVLLNIEFGEEVKNFTAEDIALSSGKVTELSDLGGGIFTAKIEGMKKEDLNVSIAEAVCTDNADNENVASEATIKHQRIIIFADKNKKPIKRDVKGVVDVTLYPNPTDGIFAIKYNADSEIGEVSIKILDINGRSLFSEKFIAESVKFSRNYDLSTYSNGLYIVQIITSKGVKTKRIVVEK